MKWSPTRRIGVCLWLFLACSAPNPTVAEAEPPTCEEAPDRICVLELAEQALNSGLERSDSLRLAIAKTYVQLGQPILAASNITMVSDKPIERLQVLTDCAWLYWKQGEQRRAELLFGDIHKELAALKPSLSCEDYTSLSYQLGARELTARELQQLPADFPASQAVKDAALANYGHHLLETKRVARASQLLEAIHTPAFRDVLTLDVAEYLLESKSITRIMELTAKVSDEAVRKAFYVERIPLAYARYGQKQQALRQAHAIDQLDKKVEAFGNLVDFYQQNGDPKEARFMLSFARDFANKLPDLNQRVKALVRVAELYFSLDSIPVARLLFDEAGKLAMRKENSLQQRLQQLIFIINAQKILPDTKGTRITAMDGIRAGYLDEYDNALDSDESKPMPNWDILQHYLSSLDGHLSANDRIELIDRIMRLQTRQLREALLKTVRGLHFSSHIASTAVQEELEDVLARVRQHPHAFEQMQMQALIGSALIHMNRLDEGKALYQEVADALEKPIFSHLPAAAITDKRNAMWHYLAFEVLAMGHIEDAVAWYRKGGTMEADSDEADAWLHALMRQKAVSYALEFFPLEHVAKVAGDYDLFADVLTEIQKLEDEQAEEMLLRLLVAYDEEGLHSVSSAIIKEIEKRDTSKWFAWNRVLDSPQSYLLPALSHSYAFQGQMDKAVEYAMDIPSSARRAQILFELAGKLPNETDLKGHARSQAPTQLIRMECGEDAVITDMDTGAHNTAVQTQPNALHSPAKIPQSGNHSEDAHH